MISSRLGTTRLEVSTVFGASLEKEQDPGRHPEIPGCFAR
jgi:hypothetical protein